MAKVYTGGWDCEFEETPPDELLCLICMCVAREPVQVDCCGKLYCKGCLDQYKKRAPTCPNCRSTGNSFKDKRSERNIRALKVKCNNHTRGCKWTGELSTLEDHISKCDFGLIQCPNMCTEGDDGNPKQIMKKNLVKHLENECKKRLFKCMHCNEKGEHSFITGPHLETCTQVKLLCSNEGCKEMIKRCDLSRHGRMCPFEKIPCKYESIGCREVQRRQDMEKHDKNEKDGHLVLAMDAVVKQQALIKTLEGQSVRASSSNHGKFTFKMSTFSDCKAMGRLFFSPSFYSSPGGYKMCIRVVANGDGQGKDTHISVYAVVMRGDYDENLSWPIKGIVTVELMNQLDDKLHHAIRFTYPEGQGDVSTQRVLTGERAKRGYGKTRFIPYSELSLKSDKNVQYLKDDCLYFRVSVETPDPKPWLACNI